MTILLSDPRVAAVDVHENGEPLVALDARFGPGMALVRSGLAQRLATAADLLPTGTRLLVVEGHRPVHVQRAIVARYSAEVSAARPGLAPEELVRLTSRFVAPVGVAPHVAGSAVDLTLADEEGRELDLGTPVDATPEQSGGRCCTRAPDISGEARVRRALLADVLGAAGLVNYPTEWWHWSWGDRYWALVTGAEAALHGPVERAGVAA